MKNTISNEWAEYLAYIETPTYFVNDKKSYPFLGRFTLKMITGNIGFNHILTIVARRYLFHNADGTLKDGDAYDRIDYARRAICAWCSMEDSQKATLKEWQYGTDFRELHAEFPELVDENGNGWYIRHLHHIVDFVNANRDKVGTSGINLADNIKKLEANWKDKVVQFQIPIFNESTKADKLIRFDDVIADALELGALRTEPIELTEKQKQWLAEKTPESVPMKIAETVLEYYLANKPTDTDWCVFPITNVEAFLGSGTLGKTHMTTLNGTMLDKKDITADISIIKIKQ